MDHDVRVAALLNVEQPLGVLVALLAGELGMDFRYTALVATFEEAIGFDELAHAACMVDVLRHHQHERVHQRLLILLGVGRKLDLHMLVVMDPVFELDALQRVLIDRLRVEVGAGADRRLLDVAFLHRLGQIVAIDDVLERGRLGPDALRCRGDLQAKDRIKFIDGGTPKGIAARIHPLRHREAGFSASSFGNLVLSMLAFSD